MSLFEKCRPTWQFRAAVLVILCWVAGVAEAATLNPGDLIVGDSRTPVMISTVNPVTGAKTVICRCAILTTLQDVAVRGTETVYGIGQIMSSVTEAVVAVDPATGAERIVSSAGNFHSLRGIAVEANGSIIVTDTPLTSSIPTTVIRVNPATGQQTVVSSGNRLRQAWGVAVGPTGQIFVAATITFPAGQLPGGRTLASGVVRVDPQTGLQTVVAYGDQFELPDAQWTEIISADDVVVDPMGVPYVLDIRFRGNTLEDEGRLIRVDPTTGAQTRLTNAFVGIDRSETSGSFVGIAVINGVLYAVDYRLSETGLPGISRFDPAVGFRDGVTSDDFFRPTGLDVVTVTMPVVTISATTPQAAEGGASGAFTVSRTGSTAAAMTIGFTLGGTATNVTDYTLSPVAPLTIAAGSAAGLITVGVVDDAVAESSETVTATLAAGVGYVVGTPGTATVTIADNDIVFRSLTVTVGGSVAGGSVASTSTGGITCPLDCSEPFADGTIVALTAVPPAGAAFRGWLGCDTSTDTQCSVTMSADRTISARFSKRFTDTTPGRDTVPVGTAVKALHFLETFDAIRTLGVSIAWTGGAPALSARITARQMNDLRVALGLAPVATGQLIRARDLDEVRAAIRARELLP